MSCSDGDSFSATVDADTLTGLQQAIQALTLYPAGLSCGLATAPVLTAIGGVASAWNASGFVVGGGRFQWPCPNGPGTFFMNFGLSAHDQDGTTTWEYDVAHQGPIRSCYIDDWLATDDTP